MLIFIDTNSDWNGGYLSHLKGFLSSFHVRDSNHEFVIYGPAKLQGLLKPFHDNVAFISDDALPFGFYKMNSWRKSKLPTILKRYNPTVHYNPMGWLSSRHKICPEITMSRNLQPFLPMEITRLPFFAKERWRLILAKNAMVKSYNNADGLIFLSEYAQEIVNPYVRNKIQKTVIPHGVNEYFGKMEKSKHYNFPENGTITVLYVSRVFTYKNHDNVILAIDSLRKKLSLNIKLTLVGGVSSSASYIIENVLKQLENSDWIHFQDSMPNHDLINWYHSADIFVFASSVENFPNILLEAMASKLPIACANKRPMIDILKNAGEYFEPENPESIARAIEALIQSQSRRKLLASEAFSISKDYSFEKMSLNTVRFLEQFA